MNPQQPLEERFEQERWLPVVGYEGLYEVSSEGNIKSVKSGKILVGGSSKGYRRILLYKQGVAKSTSIHRVVGITFIPNPENKPQINHKNGVRSDNRLTNLEWVTGSENMTHASRVLGLKPVNKGVWNPICSKGHNKLENPRFHTKGWLICRICKTNTTLRLRRLQKEALKEKSNG